MTKTALKPIINQNNFNREFKIIRQAIIEAGAKVKTAYLKFDRHQIRLKARNEIFTTHDLLSERILTLAIKKNFPTHEFLTEESFNQINITPKSDYLWIIDPIDGTTNFSTHNPIWCISVGLAYQGRMVLGIIYSPMTDEIFLAITGQGAYLQTGQQKPKQIKVSDFKDGKIINTYCMGNELENTKLGIKYYTAQKLNKIDCRQPGSAALELCSVASGRVESSVIPGAKAWDVAAGSIIVREAGGLVTDFDNQPWNYQKNNIVATNGLIHEEILQVIRKL